MSEFLFVSDDRLNILVKVIEKLNANTELWASMGHQLFEKLTLAETTWIAVLIACGDISDEQTRSIETHLKIMDLIGVPLTVPLYQMSNNQKQVVKDGEKLFKSMIELRKLWSSANEK